MMMNRNGLPWKRRIPGLMLGSVLGFAGGVVSPAQPGGEADESDESTARIDRILTNLQRRSDGLKDIRCKVRFVEDDQVNLSKGIKEGEILFLMTEPNPHFLIRFDKSVRDGVVGKREWYLFDGRFLYEAIERLQQVTRRDIAPPGEKIDLFDLEKSPFPLPFGQKKETILRNFDVTLAAPASTDPPGTDHLVCIPKPNSAMYRKCDKLELFVRRDVHLPSRLVVTKNEEYEINATDLLDLSEKSMNTGVTPDDFTRPKAWRKYEEIVETP